MRGSISALSTRPSRPERSSLRCLPISSAAARRIDSLMSRCCDLRACVRDRQSAEIRCQPNGGQLQRALGRRRPQ